MVDELDRIAKELDEADIPKEVWIGTDSTADRVSWLIIRNKLNQQNSRSRHGIIEAMAEVIESALNTVNGATPEWREAAKAALVLAGRRKVAQP